MLIQNSEKSPEVFKNQELSELLGCSLCQLYSERLAALAKHRPRIFLQVFPGLISGTDLHRRTWAVPTCTNHVVSEYYESMHVCSYCRSRPLINCWRYALVYKLLRGNAATEVYYLYETLSPVYCLPSLLYKFKVASVCTGLRKNHWTLNTQPHGCVKVFFLNLWVHNKRLGSSDMYFFVVDMCVCVIVAGKMSGMYQLIWNAGCLL